MKTKDIVFGTYVAKVSNRLVHVTVFQGPFTASNGKPFFRVRNNATGRILSMTAARLRRRVLNAEEIKSLAPFTQAAFFGASRLLGRTINAAKRSARLYLEV